MLEKESELFDPLLVKYNADPADAIMIMMIIAIARDLANASFCGRMFRFSISLF